MTGHGKIWRTLAAWTLALMCLAGMSCALADTTVTMTFVGDVTLGGENYLQGKDYSFTGFARANGYDYFLRNVQELFQNDDVTVINLEGTLTNSTSQEDTGKTYRFRADEDLVNVLTVSSVEACNINNNHIWDFGPQGYYRTHEALDNAGVGYFGHNEVYVWSGKGVRIGFLGLYSADISAGREWAENQIAHMKQNGVNAVVVSFHMGAEYSPVHNDIQNWAATNFIEAGADLIIMHHPHVVQGVDIIHDRTVFYSLGNFCFGGNCKVRAMESMVVSAEMTFSDSGEYLGQQMTIYPAHISGTYPESNFQPTLVTGEDAQGVMTLIQADTAFVLPPFDEEKGYVRMPYLPADGSGVTRVMSVNPK